LTRRPQSGMAQLRRHPVQEAGALESRIRVHRVMLNPRKWCGDLYDEAWRRDNPTAAAAFAKLIACVNR
jgi:hypothetical protein